MGRSSHHWIPNLLANLHSLSRLIERAVRVAKVATPAPIVHPLPAQKLELLIFTGAADFALKPRSRLWPAADRGEVSRVHKRRVPDVEVPIVPDFLKQGLTADECVRDQSGEHQAPHELHVDDKSKA